MKFVIFGGTGFVGRNLEKYLKEKNHMVISASRSGGPGVFKVDVTKAETFSEIDFIPDVVVNCASVVPAKGKTSRDPQFLNDLFKTNAVGGANIANWAVKIGVKKIINCSTLVVTKKPWPFPLTEQHFELPEGFHVGYSMSKLTQEQIMSEYVKNSQTNILHLRLSAVYGPDMVQEGVIFDILDAAKKNKDIRLKNAGKNFVDLIHVQDVCKGIEEVAKRDFYKNSSKMNLASGKEISILQLTEKIKEVTGSSSVVKNDEEDKSANHANISIEKFLKFIGFKKYDFCPVERGLRELAENVESKSHLE